jgi:hypothetical protein
VGAAAVLGLPDSLLIQVSKSMKAYRLSPHQDFPVRRPSARFGTGCYHRERWPAGVPRPEVQSTRESHTGRQERDPPRTVEWPQERCESRQTNPIGPLFSTVSGKNEPNSRQANGRVGAQRTRIGGSGSARHEAGQDTYRGIDRRQTAGSRHGG